MTTEPTGSEAAAEVTTPAENLDPNPATPGEEQQAQEGQTEPQPEGEAPKPKLTAQQRIDQLTWKAREAERRAEEAEARLAAIRPPEPQPTSSGDDEEPNPADYHYGTQDVAYISDVATYRATKAIRQEFEARQAREREEAAQQSFVARRNAFAAKVTEQNEGAMRLLSDRSLPVSEVMIDVILDSDKGVQVADYLGTNPAEMARIAVLPPHRQGVELGLIQARLSTQATPKTATTAPEPPPVARGQGGRFQVPADTDDFSAFRQQIAAPVLGGNR
jgi:hypothetical protein